MANQNKINGLSPVAYLSGAAYTGAARMYAIPISDTTASYAIGDVVQSATSSGSTIGCDTTGVPYVQKLTAGTAIVPVGVIVGVRVADPGPSLQGTNLDLTQTFILAGTRTAVRYVYVADDPNLLFSAFIGSAGVTLANLRKNAALGSYYSGADQTYAVNQNATVTTLLSQNAPYSNLVLVSSNTTPTLPIQVLGTYQTPNNTATATAAAGAYVQVLCRFNYHEFGVATASNLTAPS
jgi:hypothetical protein